VLNDNFIAVESRWRQSSSIV